MKIHFKRKRRFEDIVSVFFNWYGLKVGRYPWVFLAVPLLITVALAPGLTKVRFNLALSSLFIPYGAPVTTEFARTSAFKSMPPNYLLQSDIKTPVKTDDGPKYDDDTGLVVRRKRQHAQHFDIVRIYAVDNNLDNILESKKLQLLFNLSKEVLDLEFEHGGETLSFFDFCEKDVRDDRYCNNEANAWLRQAALLFKDKNVRNNPNLQFSYPVMYLFKRPKDIGNVIFGVNVTGASHEIVGAKVVTMHMMVRFQKSPRLWNAYSSFRKALDDFWLSKGGEYGLEFVAHNERAMTDELFSIITTAVPLAIPCTILMMLFVILSNISTDGRKSKPVEALLSVISVWLALFCTFGLLFYCGVPFNPVASTMPFLVLAIVLGYFFCGTPAVADFCLFTAVGVAFDFFMQTTFYAAMMTFGGRKERSFYGCANLEVDISPRKYVLDSSPIQKFMVLADLYIWADNVQPTFFVMKPPDLRDFDSRARLNDMVFRLETTEFSIGRVSTNFWLWEYQRFLTDYIDIDMRRDFYNRSLLYEFFNAFGYEEFREFVRFKPVQLVSDGQPCFDAFSFQTSFYGLDSWDKRTAALQNWRLIVSEYPEMDVFLGDIFSPFIIDQRRSIAPSAMQTIGCAIIAMAIISAILIPDKLSVFYVTLCMLSIAVGVCGFLTLWDCTLDSVSLGCIVMSIGFAIDFSAHVVYRYHRSELDTPNEKLSDTLEAIGWPLLQAGLSTIAGVLPLPLVPAYLIRVFFKTVILVCTFGLLHGLLWLPQLMTAWDNSRHNTARLDSIAERQSAQRSTDNSEKNDKTVNVTASAVSISNEKIVLTVNLSLPTTDS